MEFLGKNCSKNVDNCLNNEACGEFGACKDEEKGFSCSCVGTHAGQFCDQSICSPDHIPCLNGAECIVQGSYINFFPNVWNIWQLDILHLHFYRSWKSKSQIPVFLNSMNDYAVRNVPCFLNHEQVTRPTQTTQMLLYFCLAFQQVMDIAAAARSSSKE